MGANSSNLTELSSNEYLRQLAGSNSLSPNEPFWNQLLSFNFFVARNPNDLRQLEEATSALCKNLAINNCRSGNFGSLVRVFLMRASELENSAQCDDNIFTWQAHNALFIIRNICKYFVENLTEEVVLDQFEARYPNTATGEEGQMNGGTARITLLEEFVSALVRILVEVPVVDVTYVIHLECVDTLLTLLSIQIYQCVPLAAHTSHIYTAIMNTRHASLAPALVEALLHNYIQQQKCSSQLHIGQTDHGVLSGLTSAVATGLWAITLGLANRKSTKTEEVGLNDKPLATQSLLLLLVLTNHSRSDDAAINPYCKALINCTDVQSTMSDTAENSTPAAATAAPSATAAAATGATVQNNDIMRVKVPYADLYRTVCTTLKDEQTTLFLYTLLHKVPDVKSYILSRTNIDQLVMPILRTLYNAQDGRSHHIYMALIIILILSEDPCYSKAVHEIMLKQIVWFKERQIGEITLGGLLILVLVRTIQFNMCHMRDQYLHTNCLAALANMSAQFTDLHPYVAQRLVSLFELLLKKHTKALQRLNSCSAVGGGVKSCPAEPSVNHVRDEADLSNPVSESESEPEADHMQELAVLEEVMRMTLEILNSCLTQSLHKNPNLIYTMLYKRSLFSSLHNIHSFQDLAHNIDLVLGYFSQRLENQHSSVSVSEVHAIIKQGAMQFKRDRLKKFPDLKFRYVEEERPEEFFIPYVWSLVYHFSSLYFNPSRIHLFSVGSSTCVAPVAT